MEEPDRRARKLPRRTCRLVLMLLCGCASSPDGGRLPIGALAGQGGPGFDNASMAIGDGQADAPITVPGTANDGECGMIAIEPMVTHSPGNLLVIFDRSMSMSSPFVFGGTTSRLDEARNAIKKALEPLVCPETASPDAQNCADTISAALLTFPTHDGVNGIEFTSLSCTVDGVAAPEQMDWQGVSAFYRNFDPYWDSRALNAGDPLYPGMHPLQYGTPISFAFERAAEALNDPNVIGNKAVLFMTDGEETPCLTGISSVNPIQQATSWSSQGIKTHVVSLAPASGLGQQFNDMIASNGGTDASITPADSDTLTDAIARIVLSSVGQATCEVFIKGAKLLDQAAACEEGRVLVGPEKVPCDQEAQREGFFVKREDTIQIVGSWCEKLQETNRLEASFPCTLLGPT